MCLFDEFFHFLDLGETNRAYFSPLLYLEPSKKFVVGGGGWWWCLNIKIVIGFGPSLGLGLKAKLINIPKQDGQEVPHSKFRLSSILCQK